MPKSMAAPVKSPAKGELARAAGGRDITVGFVDQLLRQPHDPILQARGFDLAVYDDLLRDDQVHSTFQQRRLAVVSREWQVEPASSSRADKRAAEFLKEQLQELRFDDLTDKMLYGMFYGWAVAECIWARDGAQVVAEDIKVRRRDRFRWDRDGALRLILPGRPEGEVMPPAKFWTFSAGGSTDDEPYGLGLGHFLYWPVFFKRHDIKFWLVFLEKFGTPTVVGTHPSGASEKEIDTLLRAASAAATDAAITIPEGMALELMEATRGGSATHETMLDAMNEAIAKIVLSQTMTTDDGSSLSQALVHETVRDEVVKADADLVCFSFTRQVATWLTAWNFPGAATPTVWRRMESEPDLKELAERDELLARVGWVPSQKRMGEVYGDGYERASQNSAPESRITPGGMPGPQEDERQPAALAERDGRDSIDELADQLADDDWEPLMAPVVEQLERLIGDEDDLAAIRARVPELVGRIDMNRLAERLARGRFAARLAGDADAPIDG